MTTGRNWPRGWGRNTTAALGLSAIGLTAYAQTAQTDGAQPSRLVVSAGAAIDEDGESFFSTAMLDINRATRTQELRFTASADVDFASNGEATFPSDPSLSLSYSNIGSPIGFQVSLSYSESDVDGLVAANPDDPSVQPSDFILDDGTRTNWQASTSLTYGARGPFGATLSVGLSDTDYVDTTDARLFDRNSTTAGLDLRFDVSRVLSITAGLGYDLTERDDDQQGEVERTSASLGFAAQATKVLRVDGSVSYVETSETIDDGAGGRLSDASDGWALDLGATIEQRNGSLRFGYARTLENAGQIDRVSVQRSLALSEVQTLSFGVGASQIDGGDRTFEADVTYAQQMRNGAIQISARQQNQFTETDDAVTTRQLSASISRELTRVSSVSADIALASVNYLDDAFEDSGSFQIGVGYRHSLTRDWDISARAYYNVAEDADTDESSQGVTLQINRAFSLFD